eukprot:5594661-Alexandrium_andersonii.AAC.1
MRVGKPKQAVVRKQSVCWVRLLMGNGCAKGQHPDEAHMDGMLQDNRWDTCCATMDDGCTKMSR